MTHPDDVPRDDGSHGTPDGPAGSGVPLDEDAAWRAIVENYGERAHLDVSWEAPDGAAGPAPAEFGFSGPAQDERGSVFDRSFLDASDELVGRPGPQPGRHDDDHFVPPPPPPLPKGTPARRLAWLGVLVPPVFMFVAALVRWPFPTWATLLLVVGFLGGFVFLVATMPREHRDDGDDGAVV